MKIATVCSNGVGSSLILRISTEKAMAELGVKAEVFATDLPTLHGQHVDLVITTGSIAEALDKSDYPNVVEIVNFVDVEALKEKIKEKMGL